MCRCSISRHKPSEASLCWFQFWSKLLTQSHGYGLPLCDVCHVLCLPLWKPDIVSVDILNICLHFEHLQLALLYLLDKTPVFAAGAMHSSSCTWRETGTHSKYCLDSCYMSHWLLLITFRTQSGLSEETCSGSWVWGFLCYQPVTHRVKVHVSRETANVSCLISDCQAPVFTSDIKHIRLQDLHRNLTLQFLFSLRDLLLFGFLLTRVSEVSPV